MGIREALARLVQGASQLPHDYQPTILSFLQLDVKKIARDLSLERRGRERGSRDEPPTESEALDEVENEIVEFVEGQVKKAHAALLAELGTYAQRLHGLDLEGRFTTIEAAAMDGISSFRSEVSRGHDRLSAPKKHLRELEQEMLEFKASHGLRRTAHYPSAARKVFQWGLIAALFLAEIAGNSYFLAKGSEYGLIGGFAEAVLIALLNIGVAMAAGHYGIRQLWHRDGWRKLVGSLSLVGWFAFAFAFNLLVAHYREASGTFFEGGGAVAIESIKSAPLALAEFHSWVLFGIGLLFGFIALADALWMDDLYPFYGHLARVLEQARETYRRERDELSAELEAITDETLEAMSVAKNDLGKRRSEHGAILAGRKRTLDTYRQHLTYLERACNTLLSIYRGANREARGSSPPVHFATPWQLTVPPLGDDQLPTGMPEDTLRAEVDRAQAALEERMREIHEEYERAFRAYHEVDKIKDTDRD